MRTAIERDISTVGGVIQPDEGEHTGVKWQTHLDDTKARTRI